jgi:hypothetical protein
MGSAERSLLFLSPPVAAINLFSQRGWAVINRLNLLALQTPSYDHVYRLATELGVLSAPRNFQKTHLGASLLPQRKVSQKSHVSSLGPVTKVGLVGEIRALFLASHQVFFHFFLFPSLIFSPGA